jgi:hypothetical protein
MLELRYAIATTSEAKQCQVTVHVPFMDLCSNSHLGCSQLHLLFLSVFHVAPFFYTRATPPRIYVVPSRINLEPLFLVGDAM